MLFGLKVVPSILPPFSIHQGVSFQSVTCDSKGGGGEKSDATDFVHAHALFTVLAYRDLVPLMLSELPPVVGMVLKRAKRAKTTVSCQETRIRFKDSHFRSAGSSRSHPRSKSTKQPRWHC